MAKSISGDPIIVQIVETHASTVPGERELTNDLKRQTARMLGACFEHRREDILQTAVRTFTESAVHLHTMLCLKEGVHHSQWPEGPAALDSDDEIDQKREQINDAVRRYIERQVRRYITFAG